MSLQDVVDEIAALSESDTKKAAALSAEARNREAMREAFNNGTQSCWEKAEPYERLYFALGWSACRQHDLEGTA